MPTNEGIDQAWTPFPDRSREGAGREELEAAVGIEPTMKDLQSSALPLGHAASARKVAESSLDAS